MRSSAEKAREISYNGSVHDRTVFGTLVVFSSSWRSRIVYHIRQCVLPQTLNVCLTITRAAEPRKLDRIWKYSVH